MPASPYQTSMREALNAAILANAAYIDWVGAPGATQTSLRVALETYGEFTNAEAQYVADNFQLVDTGGAGSDPWGWLVGLNATLWRQLDSNQNETDQYTFAFGGTEKWEDLPADLLADALIGVFGQAHGQTQALYYYLKRFFTATELNVTGLPGLGLLTGSDIVDATGHSLGGHLAQYAIGKFNNNFNDEGLPVDVFTDGYTFNGAGIGGIGGLGGIPGSLNTIGVIGYLYNFYRVLGGNYEWNEGNFGIENFISSAGLDFIASDLSGRRPGDDIRLFIEDQSARGLSGNHSIQAQVDSLFVHYMFESFLGVDENGESYAKPEILLPILRASSNNPFDSLERVANHVKRLLPNTPVSTVSDANVDASLDERDGTLTALAIAIADELEANPRPATLYDLKTLGKSNMEFYASEDTDRGLAFRVAMMLGQPFVLDGLDYQAAFNSDGKYDRDNFTDRFIADRAAFAAALFTANTQDVASGGRIGEFQDYRYYADEALNRSIVSYSKWRGDPPPLNELPQVLFGDDTVNTITGGDMFDSIYGLGGNDTLEGGLGDDYIEGGDGNDELIGGEGKNTLLGGDGNDIYRIGVKETAVITDSDGQGAVLVERDDGTFYQLGSTPIKAVADQANVYRDEDGFTYTLVDTNLSISSPDGAKIIIREFDTQVFPLGINLTGFTAFFPPAGSVEFDVDVVNQPPGPVDDAYIAQYGRYNSLGHSWSSAGVWYWSVDYQEYLMTDIEDSFRSEIVNAIAVPDGALNGSQNRFYTISGGFGDTFMTGDDGFNWLIDDIALWPTTPYIGTYGMGPVMGDDVIRGLGGDDWLRVSGGDDYVEGGAGDDVIISTHAGYDISIAINGDPPFTFTPYGDVSWVAEPGHSSDDRLFGGIGNDYIIAHGGNQIMDGGADDDELFGGAGNDVLIGGDGNDVLSGDTRQSDSLFDLLPETIPNAPPEYAFNGDNLTFDASDPDQWGNDTLDGGDGDDVLYGGAGDDSLSGGAGNDRLQGDFVFAYADLRQGLQDRPTDPSNIHGDDILLGGAGNDELLGYGGDDLIEGGDGDDIAAGGDDDDIVLGDAGNDELQGNEGNDFLYGGDGDDILFGQEDDDELYGEDGMDQLVGGAGNDRLSGGLMDDALFGEAGEDILEGGAGVDDLQGGDDDDILIGGSGNDLLFGGAGNDTYVITGSDGQDQITDSQGNNILAFDFASTNFQISIENGLYFIDYAPNNYLFMDAPTFNAIDEIQFTGGVTLSPDYFIDQFQPTTATGTTITLGNGASTADLVLFARNDDLVLAYTGPVQNWIDTSGFSDRDILVEEGDATDYGYPVSAPAISLKNWYRATSNAYVNFIRDETSGFINLFIDAPVARIFDARDDGSLFSGSDEGDILLGGASFDVFVAGDGDDQITGGEGPDTLIGGPGNDSYFYNIGDSADVITDESGVDTLTFGPGITQADLTITLSTGSLVVQVGPAANNDVITIPGWLDAVDSPIETFAFDDGTTLNVDDVNALVTGNVRPEVSGALGDQTFDFEQPVSFTIPAGTFTDPNGDALTYSATLAGGSPLPGWLSFDQSTQTFSGTTPPQAQADLLSIVVTAYDTAGLPISDSFDLEVGLNGYFGTPGNDVLNGDALDNVIIGFAGDDTLRGGDGNDFLRADEGRDFLFGDDGDDTLFGNIGFNDLTGGAGNDLIIAGPDGARTYGGDGDDTFIGGESRDTFDGGDGANIYEIAFDGGIDLVEFIAPGTHTIRFGPGILLADFTSSFEGSGQSFDLIMELNPADPTDTLTIPDVFYRGFTGGSDDVAPRISSNPVHYVFEFEDGTSLTLPEMIDRSVVGTPGDDFLFPNSNNDAVFGGDGDDSILGRDYPFSDDSNMLYGEGGADYVSGGGGEDFISGGDGDDVLIGGDGDDTIIGGLDDDFLRGDEGNDTLNGGDGNDSIQGNEGNDIIMGGAGDDNLNGDVSVFQGADQIFGGDGNDTINGGGFADFIEGGAGDDIIAGGSSSVDARDMLRGGAGDDQFNDASDDGATHYLYDAGDGHDTISDTGHVDFSGFLLEDRFEFVNGSGIQLEDLQVTRVGDDLVLTVSSTDSITFLNWFLSIDNQIEEFITYDDFGAQVVSTAADIEALLDVTNSAPTLDNALLDENATEGQALNFGVPGNAFSDPDAGDVLSYTATLVGGAALPTWLNFDAATQTFTGTPPNNSNGSLDIEVTATDAGGLSASDAFTLTIADANFAPEVANPIADTSIAEGGNLNYTVAADAFSDSDPGDTLTYSAQLSGGAALPAWLIFDAASRTFTGTPPNNSNGDIDVEVIATDGGGLSISDTFTLTVTDTNVAPTLDNLLADAGATEGQALNLAIPADAFSDPDTGDSLTYSAQLSGGAALPAWLSFDSATRTFTGTPPNNSNGDINIEVIATDSGGLSTSDVFTLNIADANFAPTLDNLIADANATEGQALNITVPGDTFSDPDAGDTLTYSAQLSGGGALPTWLGFDAASRTFTGTPPNDANGDIDIEVIATDTGGLSTSDVFTLSIANANFAPTLDNLISDTNATEGQVLSYTVPGDAFSDPDAGDTLTYSAQLSGGGALPAWLSFDAASRTFSGTPPNNSNGNVDIEVIATDNGGLTASDTFTLSIADANFAPTLDNAIMDANATEGQALNVTVPADAFSDADAGDSLTYSAQLSGGGALPAWLSFDAVTRTFTGTPPNNSNGSVNIEVIATDSGALSTSDVFTLNIADANFGPTLDNLLANANATEGQALNLTVPGDAFSDPDAGDTLTYTAQLSGGGALPVWLSFDAATRTFTGTPPNNSSGDIDIEVIATDSGGLSTSDTFTLGIADANFAPTLDNLIGDANATEGQLLNFAVPADTFSDPDTGDTLTYAAQLSGGGALPAWLSFDAATQTFTGTPPNNSNGAIDIEVIATDSGGLTVSDTFTLSVADSNFAPTLDNLLADANATEGQALNLTLPPNAFSDPDVGDSLTYSAQLSGGGALPAWLSFDAVTQTFTGTPPNNSNGSVDIEVIATDSGGLTVSDTFTLSVADANFAPTLDNLIADANATEGQALNYTVAADAFSDPDAGDSLTYSAQLSDGGLLPTWLSFDAVTRAFTGTPPNNSNGDIDIEVIATDSGGLSVSDTFTLSIADTNFAPTLDNAIADANATEGQALNVTVAADAFSDPDAGDLLTYSAQLNGGGALPAWLSFDAATRTFTGTPPNNSNGVIDIEVTATDIGGLAVSDTFTLSIADTNFAPTLDNAIADTGATEGQAFNFTVAPDAFSDPDTGDTLSYSARLQGGGLLPAWLSFDAATQTFTGTPPNASAGDINIEVIATDTGGLSVSDVFTLTINETNFAPNLDNPIVDSNATEGQAFSFTVAADAFSDPDAGDSLTYAARLSDGSALPAWLSFDAVTRTFTGTPPNNSNGALDIEVIATDNGGLSASDIFSLDIADANFAPELDNLLADADAIEGQAFNLTIPADAFSDPDAGDSLTYSARLSSGGVLPAWLSFDAATRTFTGTPPNNSSGDIDIEVVVTDGGGLSTSDTFALSVADANFAPTLDNVIADANATEGQPFSLTIPADAFSDPDAGDTLTYSAQLSGGGALPAWLSFDATTITFTGTPPNNSNGGIDIEVVATDTGGLSISDSFTLSVADVNFAPTLDNLLTDANATEGEALNFSVAADAFSDPDSGDSLTYSAQRSGGGALPAWLSFDTATQTFTGTPPNNSNGNIDIEVIATDSGGLSVSDTFTLSIADANLAPTLDNLITDANATEGQALNVTVPADTFSDSDAGDTLTYAAQVAGGGALPVWLSFDAATQTFSGTPPNNSNGSIDIEVIATDSGGLSVSDTFTLSIADANFAPTLDNPIMDANATEGQALNITVPADAFSDSDTGDTLTYAVQVAGGGALPAWLSFNAATRTFTGTPPNNSNGDVDIEVTATDGSGLSVSDTFTLSIADANFAPNLDNVLVDANAAEGQALSLTLPADAFSDPDTGDTLTYSAQLPGGGGLPAWLSFDAATQTFTGTPPNNSNGNIDIEVIATDSGGLTASDTFVLSIADTNFAPNLDSPIADTGATEGQLFSYTFAGDAFSDPDAGDTLSYSAQLSGGDALPAWLSFDAASRTFTGTAPNGGTGDIDVEVTATDSGGLTVTDTFTISITDTNFAPNLDIPIGDIGASEGSAFNYVIAADTFSDPDAGDSLTYSAQLSGGGALPAWLGFDAVSRTFSGTPPNNANGDLDIEVIATDTGGLSVSDTFTLSIADENFAPVLDNLLMDANATEGQALSITVPADTFSDPDNGDSLTYSAQLSGGGALPAWLIFDAATRTFTGTPPNNTNGNLDIEVIATDTGGLSISDTFSLGIADTNFAPNLDNLIVDANATEGQALNITVPADAFTDPDAGDVLSYTAQLSDGAALPAWLNFDAATRTFTGTPPNNSNGVLDIEVTATDSGGLSVADTFALAIADTNFAPTLDNAIADTSATEGQAFNLVLAADVFSDPDTGDALTLSARLAGGAALPAWLSFDAANGTFNGTPPVGATGVIDVEVVATDTGGLAVADSFLITVSDGSNVITGTPDDDVLDGTPAADQIFGLAGNDILRGNDGDDNIDGGTGNDMLFGGLGADTLLGRGGADDIYGGDGNDTAQGGSGNDELHGEAGDDNLSGDGGRDFIFGEDGNDTLSGGAGRDVIEGGAGNDSISGGSAADILRGNAGADMLFGDAGRDTLRGGAGNDTIDGGDGNDDIRGNGGDDTIIGGLGDDTILGQGGADTIQGNAGNDDIDGGGGRDTIFGGDGADTIVGGNGADTVFGGIDDDTILGGDGNDVIRGGDGKDQLFGELGADILIGGGGDDTIDGGDGSDDIRGNGGNDQLSGGLGDDVIDGQGGADTIRGGAGNDTIMGGGAADTLIGGDGDDQLSGEQGADTLSGGAGADTIDGGGGADDIRGNGGGDVIMGGAGNDTVFGQGGTDVIEGGTGNDMLDGGGARDTLRGDDGDDTLIGGAARDTLIGGEGSDVYVYELGDGNDIIDNQSTDAATDRLVIGAGITTTGLGFRRSGNDLLITVGINGNRIRVDDWFSAQSQEIDFVETTDDGVILTAADINAIISSGGSTPQNLVADISGFNALNGFTGVEDDLIASMPAAATMPDLPAPQLFETAGVNWDDKFDSNRRSHRIDEMDDLIAIARRSFGNGTRLGINMYRAIESEISAYGQSFSHGLDTTTAYEHDENALYGPPGVDTSDRLVTIASPNDTPTPTSFPGVSSSAASTADRDTSTKPDGVLFDNGAVPIPADTANIAPPPIVSDASGSEFDAFRSAVEELDAATLAEAINRLSSVDQAYAILPVKRVGVRMAHFLEISAPSSADNAHIEQTLNRFVNSIAGFTDGGSDYGDAIGRDDDFNNVHQNIVMPN